jgi:hypothetical protein
LTVDSGIDWTMSIDDLHAGASHQTDHFAYDGDGLSPFIRYWILLVIAIGCALLLLVAQQVLALEKEELEITKRR